MRTPRTSRINTLEIKAVDLQKQIDAIPDPGTGPKGDTGTPGDTGAKGDRGIQGVKGDTGTQGNQGIKGDAGTQGVQGTKGDTGLKGDKGNVGDTGPAGSPKVIEVASGNVSGNGGLATLSWPAFLAAPAVDVIIGWSGDQMLTGAVVSGSVTTTGCQVSVKRSRGALLLTAGPFENAPSGTPISVRLHGNR